MANYPSDPAGGSRSGPDGGPSGNRYLPPLDANRHRTWRDQPDPHDETEEAQDGERLGVTRAAAMRSREMGSRMYSMVQRAATADGADKSGLTALTWPVVANFAVDSAMAVALANTLFFAAATGESKGRVALYLLITIAPFAVIAPLIGPALDRVQHGRRAALSMSFLLRTVLAVILIATYDSATVMFDVMGFGKPMDEVPILLQPGVLSIGWGSVVRQLAAGLGLAWLAFRIFRWARRAFGR